jgi:uncharacterized membrane protein
MGALDKLESTLDESLNKKAPFSLPKNGRKALADSMWVIALVIGVLQLLSTYWLWGAGHRVDRLVDYANSLSVAYGGPAVVANHLGLFYYLSLLAMAAVAVFLLFATPGLKAMKKSGWNFLFYALVIQVAVAIARLFSSVNGGLGDFVGALIGAVIGAYFLFQVRDYFVNAKAAEQPKPATLDSAKK